MFQHLAAYSTIVVTGPQRSGTTIAAKMIARDLGRTHIDEMEFGPHVLFNLYKLIDRAAVIQAPALSAYCHLFPAHVAVVFMRRDTAAIAASQNRTIMGSGATWTEEEEPAELRKYFREVGPVADVKYDVWERFQKPLLEQQGKTYFELAYDELARHPLWVPPAERVNWHAKQTENPPPAEDCAAFNDPATADTAPVDTAPVDTAPVDTAPVDTARGDTAPVPLADTLADPLAGEATLVDPAAPCA